MNSEIIAADIRRERGAPDVSLAATPAREDISNALYMAELWATLSPYVAESQTFAAVARLLRAALRKLEAK